MQKNGEVRYAGLQAFSVEQRAGSETEAAGMVLEGYAVVFDCETVIGDIQHGGFYETIDSGAFNGCDMRDVPLRYNHSDDVPILARTRNKSLQLTVDSKGLKIKAELLDTQDARDMYKRIKSGLISAMSFAFSVAEDGEQISSKNGAPVRRITKFKRLYDVAIVDIPAYEETSICARSLELAKGWRAFENEKREKKAAAEIQAAIMRWTV